MRKFNAKRIQADEINLKMQIIIEVRKGKGCLETMR